MQRKARGAQRLRHISWIDDRASTAQRRDAPEVVQAGNPRSGMLAKMDL